MSIRSENSRSGVYVINCGPTGEVYIGSSKHITNRLDKHWWELKRGEHYNEALQQKYNLHGKSAFSYSVLEFCEINELKDKEELWIRNYGAYSPGAGFNIYKPQNNEIGGENQRRERSDKDYSIFVINTKTGNIYHCVNPSTASDTTGVPVRKICDCCNYWIKSGYSMRSYSGYMFVRKEDYVEGFDYINYKPPVKQREKKVPVAKMYKSIEDYDVKRVPVVAHCIATGVETTYRSRIDCIRALGLTANKLNTCIINPFGRYKHKGFYFRRVGV